jgi:hypothetical protein
MLLLSYIFHKFTKYLHIHHLFKQSQNLLDLSNISIFHFRTPREALRQKYPLHTLVIPEADICRRRKYLFVSKLLGILVSFELFFVRSIDQLENNCGFQIREPKSNVQRY